VNGSARVATTSPPAVPRPSGPGAPGPVGPSRDRRWYRPPACQRWPGPRRTQTSRLSYRSRRVSPAVRGMQYTVHRGPAALFTGHREPSIL